MINKINTTLDVALKALSLLFTFCIFLGTTVTWSYLNKSGLGNEISSVISSPQVLLTIALYSVVVSVGVIWIVALVPAIVNFCKETTEVQWNNASQPNRFFIHFALILSPLALFMLSAWCNVRDGYFLLFYLSVCLLMTSFFYKMYGGPALNNTQNKIKNFGITYVALAAAYGLLLFSILFFLKVTQYLEENEILQWIILFVIFILYSSTVAIATSSSNFISYIPVVILSLVLLAILFADTASTNVVSRLGVGSYSSSYAIGAKNLAAINNNSSYKIEETENKDVLILRDVWVVAALPNKLILSPKKGELSTYSIPISAVLGEINNANK